MARILAYNKMQDMPKTMKFGGKVYRWYRYEPMKPEANRMVQSLRNHGKPARIVPQRGYGGGWNIYVRG